MPATPSASGLNAGYVELLREQYLENPEAVDPAWRELFERADEAPPAEAPEDGNGAVAAPPETAPPETDGRSTPVEPLQQTVASPGPEPEPVETPAPKAQAPALEETLQQSVASVVADVDLLQAVASGMAL